MKALRVMAAFVAASVALVSLSTCKPIGYYLAQVYKVHGQVTVLGTDPPEPIGSVEVFVGGWQYSELTNCNGDYEMEMAAGTWTINFVKDGYEPVSVPEVRVGPDNPRHTLNVAMARIKPKDGMLTVRVTGAGDHDGAYFYYAVVATGDDISNPDNWRGVAPTSAIINGGTVECITEAHGGGAEAIFTGGESYDVGGIIDADRSGGPTSGDYTFFETAAIDGDTTLDLVYPTDFQKMEPELLTVTGTITIEDGLWSDPVGASETILVGIDTYLPNLVTLDIPNIDRYELSSLAHGTTTYNYSISGVSAGAYYLAAAIDMNADGEVNLGDYAGIYGEVDPGDPANPADDPPANVVIDADHTVFDFRIEQFTWDPCGTWVNARYNADGEEPGPMAKQIISEGTAEDDPEVTELYDNTWDTTPAQTIEFQITDHWTVGRTQWFQCSLDMGQGIAYFAMRISEEDTVLEVVSSDGSRPQQIDPDGDTYVIYYRQEE